MKKKIVIVEDDFLIQETYKGYVEDLGHEVISTFTNGQQAIEYFKDNRADLILMDIRLENELDGIETMKRIEHLTSIPVVYISGNTEDFNYSRAISTNIKGFFSKPLEPGKLEEAINSLNELTDSILYAERIQKAIFPHRQEIHKVFSNSIYIFKPRDVISGDFSVLRIRKKFGDVVGAVGDCTGHGIPAALLSVLCHEILESSIRRTKDLRTIIKKLNNSLIRNLSRAQSENGVSDALDLILFRVIPDESIIEICGIKRPFIYFDYSTQQHSYYNLKGQSLGIPFESEEQIPFMTFKYHPNDVFYFFTDGVTDQFGGQNFKKLMRRGLLEFLDKLVGLPILQREIELDLFLRKWQGNLDQTDDILFMGILPYSVNLKSSKTAAKLSVTTASN